MYGEYVRGFVCRGAVPGRGLVDFILRNWDDLMWSEEDHNYWFASMVDQALHIGHAGLAAFFKKLPRTANTPGLHNHFLSSFNAVRPVEGYTGSQILLACQTLAYLRDMGIDLPWDALALACLDQKAVARCLKRKSRDSFWFNA